MFPLAPKRFRLIAGSSATHEADVGDPELPELQRLYDDVASIRAKMGHIVWSSRFRINSRMLEKLRVGSIFFGGDAAHIHSPAGGQGMNTGIQDMMNLCWKLAAVWRGEAVAALLDTYDGDRLPVIRNVVTRTEAATDALVSDNPYVHDLVTHLGPLLLGTNVLARNGIAMVSQTAVHYRSSPLSTTARAGGRIRAGDRVPYFDVAIATGGRSGLYALLDPSRFTLLVIGNAGGDTIASALEPWHFMLDVRTIAPTDDRATFTTTFGIGPSLVLSRPDAYVGFVGRLDDLQKLVEWFQRWFPRAVIA